MQTRERVLSAFDRLQHSTYVRRPELSFGGPTAIASAAEHHHHDAEDDDQRRDEKRVRPAVEIITVHRPDAGRPDLVTQNHGSRRNCCWDLIELGHEALHISDWHRAERPLPNRRATRHGPTGRRGILRCSLRMRVDPHQ